MASFTRYWQSVHTWDVPLDGSLLKISLSVLATGAVFDREGIHFEGPAPRPLERIKITLAADGQLEIDKATKFLHEKGQWDQPGASLKV